VPRSVWLRGRHPQCAARAIADVFGLPWAIAVHDLYLISSFAQTLSDLLRDHDGAMLSTSTAEADGQVALSLVNVVRQQIDQEFGDAADEFLGLRKRADVFGDARVASGEGPKFGNEMGIRQEADVEHQIGIFRHAVLEPEAHARNQHLLLRAGGVLELVGEVSAQFVDVELRGIDDKISEPTDSAQMAALGGEGGADGGAGSERMGATRFAEAAEQDGIASLEKNDARGDEALDGLQDGGEFFELRAFAHVDDQGGARNLARSQRDLGKAGDQFDGQVVDAIISEVFEGLECGGLPGAAHAGDDD